MAIINEWIDSKLAYIANALPSLIQTEPDSFICGHNVGYKQALLELEGFIDTLDLPKEFLAFWDKNRWEMF